MIDEALFDAEEKMEKAVAVARDDLSTIRTGRANPGMFSRIVIDWITTGSSGRSVEGSVGLVPIVSTTSWPLLTVPSSAYWGGSPASSPVTT